MLLHYRDQLADGNPGLGAVVRDDNPVKPMAVVSIEDATTTVVDRAYHPAIEFEPGSSAGQASVTERRVLGQAIVVGRAAREAGGFLGGHFSVSWLGMKWAARAACSVAAYIALLDHALFVERRVIGMQWVAYDRPERDGVGRDRLAGAASNLFFVLVHSYLSGKEGGG